MAYRKADPHGGSSSATREIAALDFLLNIPLAAEQEIVRSGLEGEQNCISSGGANPDVNYSIDEEEKAELDLLRGMKNFPLGADESANNEVLAGDHEFLDGHDNGGRALGMTWWQPMIQKNKKFFSAEEERIKRREQLELEMGKLEGPDGTDALSAMEEGKLQKNPLQQQDDEKKSSNKAAVNNMSASYHETGNFYGERMASAPGRRLDGYEATLVKIPVEERQTEAKTTMRTIVRKAAVRQWEREMVSSPSIFSRGNEQHKKKQCLLDGRIFFSGMSSYPMAVFSVIKYEPKKEEENRRRQKIEALGGGGSQFVMPSRDWRGVSYRALLPRGERKNKAFNKMIKQGREKAFERRKKRMKRRRRRERRNRIRKQKKEERANSSLHDVSTDESNESNTVSRSDTDSDDISLFENDTFENDLGSGELEVEEVAISDDYSSSSEDSVSYYPGFLDDPEMTKGRHRHVMVGDRVTGCVVSSTIHFVSPVDLKADLNKQFRNRFDQWEPPKPQRKYIGARVIEGCYTLIDPTEPIAQQEENDQRNSDDEGNSGRRSRKSSIAETETIRMPPSLTLSKIRNIKQQALLACIDCNIEVSTVALACVYFERLALDCRVDKSNRRLTFAACLLIAIKINEANIALVNEQSNKTSKKGVGVIKSWIRMSKDGDVFSTLLEFFTHQWSLSLKTLFAAEFGVFAALNFKLHATPSQVSFHFKRLMKTLEWSSRDYLGKEMYEQWQDCLVEEKFRKDEKQERREKRQQRKEEKLLKLQHELQMMEEVKNDEHHQSMFDRVGSGDSEDFCGDTLQDTIELNLPTPSKKKAGLSIFNRIGLRKSTNNLSSLVSPQRIKKDGSDEVSKDSFDSTIFIRENQVLRSSSSPNLKRM